MGFILGFLMGLLSAVVLFCLLIYLVCRRSDNVAVAKFINGIAQALAHKPRLAEEPVPEENRAKEKGERVEARRLGFEVKTKSAHLE